MSSEGLEATEAEMEEVLQDMEADAEQAVMD
jgi:translation initiation factor eIF-2B subunit gamma